MGNGVDDELIVGIQIIVHCSFSEAGLTGFNQFLEGQSTMLVLIDQTNYKAHIGFFQLLHLIAVSAFLLHGFEQHMFFLTGY